MHKRHIIKFLGLEGIKIKNVKEVGKTFEISMTLKQPNPRVCPHCGHKTLHYHDKKVQRLKDIPYNHHRSIFI
ncbi:MAG: transposase family protein [Tissierellia bacterium]|nr:transposase family protein [Tissierellia bacterium]